MSRTSYKNTSVVLRLSSGLKIDLNGPIEHGLHNEDLCDVDYSIISIECGYDF